MKAALRARTDAAIAAGVFGVPSVRVGPFVFWGDDQLEQAAVLAGPSPATPSRASHRAPVISARSSPVRELLALTERPR